MFGEAANMLCRADHRGPDAPGNRAAAHGIRDRAAPGHLARDARRGGHRRGRPPRLRRGSAGVGGDRRLAGRERGLRRADAGAPHHRTRPRRPGAELPRGRPGGRGQRGGQGGGGCRAARPRRGAVGRPAGSPARRTALRVPTDITLAAADADRAWPPRRRARVAEGFTRSQGEGRHATRPAISNGCARSGRRSGPRCGCGWMPTRAGARGRRYGSSAAIEDAGLDVELVEQPVPRWDLDGLAWVSDRVHAPIMADEAVFSVRDLVEVIRRRAADMVNVKLAKCGGLGPARTLLSLAHEHGLGTIVGSMMEGPSASARRPAWSRRTGRPPSPTSTPPGGWPRRRCGADPVYDGAHRATSRRAWPGHRRDRRAGGVTDR